MVAGSTRSSARVDVLMGGVSAEHDISVLSGEAVCEALKDLGYSVRKIMVEGALPSEVVPENTDVAFVALHGGAGEDGTIQAQLEDAGVSYTGSNSQASRLAMNKLAAKRIFEENAIPTPVSFEVGSDTQDNDVLNAARRIGFPLVVKPVSEGSTLGVSIVPDEGGLGEAVESARAFRKGVFLESFIAGKELTVGIIGDEALPVVEIRAGGGFYDYSAKYKDAETEYLTEIDIPKKLYDSVRKIGRAAHAALGCRHLSRVDLRLSKEMKPFVLEVNTIPGLTCRSLLPKAAWAAGMSYADLIERIILLAMKGSEEE